LTALENMLDFINCGLAPNTVSIFFTIMIAFLIG